VLHALRELPVSRWSEHVMQRPGWITYGAFRALLGFARKELDRHPPSALAITTFVTDHIDAVSAPPDTVALLPFLRGLSWKEHANALFMNERYEEAEQAAERAGTIFGSEPALIVDMASATLLRAMSLHELGETVVALKLVLSCVHVFGAHAQPRKFLVALQVCAGFLFDLKEYVAARDTYRVALRIAEKQLHDRREIARTLNNIGQCSVFIGDLEEAEEALQGAFHLFHEEQMDTEMLRAVVGLARVARKQKKFKRALKALHSAYVDLLDRGLQVAAACVLVELVDVVTELTGNLTYARNEGARLAARFGDYDVPGNVRQVMDFVNRGTRTSRSVQRARAVFAHARTFLRELLARPSTAFALPA
jgi:tetratricopeptide (TPR) repeat protein